MSASSIARIIQHNCDISDARDNGIYSICTLVLKLRNLYKWEHHIEPWAEPESADLLDWIEAKENYWGTIAGESFEKITGNGADLSPWDLPEINRLLDGTGLVYGAGYGRSMKAIFFLSEKIREEVVEGCPVLVLGRERAKELASPFALLQEGTIFIRREPLRFFFWDHIQDIRASSKASLHFALNHYRLLKDGRLDHDQFRLMLDTIVDEEIPIFIHHEVGEMLQKTLDSTTLKTIINRFPDSAVEFVGRSLKDILADTHPRGMISYIIRERKEASLGFYVGFLDGVRKILFPEMITAFDHFSKDGDWGHIEAARIGCREKNIEVAGRMKAIVGRLDNEPEERIQEYFNREILGPLGLDAPAKKG